MFIEEDFVQWVGTVIAILPFKHSRLWRSVLHELLEQRVYRAVLFASQHPYYHLHVVPAAFISLFKDLNLQCFKWQLAL